LAARYKAIGSSGGAITDHGVIHNSIEFLKEMQDAKLKPIIGVELYICDEHASVQTKENRKLTHLVILAKNTQGWKQLLKIIHESNKPQHYYYKPRLSLDQLSQFLDGNIIGFSGHLGSHLGNIAINGTIEEGVAAAKYFQELFKGKFWLETQLMDNKHSPDQIKATSRVREISKIVGIPCIATPDAHYCEHKDAELQRIVLCSNMKTTFKLATKPDFQLSGFFNSDCFHVPTYDEMLSYGHTQEELENTNKILEEIEEYEILAKPKSPKFDCPNNLSNHEYLKQLCRDGWAKLIKNQIPQEKHEEYKNRIIYELETIQEADLAGYFLILWDIVQFCHRKNIMVGAGRGSVGGSLMAFLLGLIKVDPIKHGLVYERFYSRGRATPEHVNFQELNYITFRDSSV